MPEFLREHWDACLLGVLLATLNLPMLWGGTTAPLAYRPDLTAQGAWWLPVTGLFAHVTWYHLLLDGLPFLLVYLCLEERSPIVRLLFVGVSGAGSIAAATYLAPELAGEGLRGLSGVTYGITVLGALELLFDSGRERAARVAAGGVLVFFLWLTAYETVTGRFPLEFLLFGMVGTPVLACHAGGIAGALAAYAAVHLARKCLSLRVPPFLSVIPADSRRESSVLSAGSPTEAFGDDKQGSKLQDGKKGQILLVCRPRGY